MQRLTQAIIAEYCANDTNDFASALFFVEMRLDTVVPTAIHQCIYLFFINASSFDAV